MGKLDQARRVSAAAAMGGGGLTALGVSLYGVLRAQAKLARRAIGTIDTQVPDSSGWYGRGRPGPAIRLALLGDSGAAGYGVKTVEQTTGAWLGSGVAELADRRVYVRRFAVVGAQSSDLHAQVERALPMQPDVAVILIGANDVTHTVRPAESVRHLGTAVRRLREAGIEVVVGTCPDLGTVAPIPVPLRHVARTWSRKLAQAQIVVTVEAGGRAVSLGSILGPEFAAAPALLFGPDRFHPSAAGYEAVARSLVPSVLAALGLGHEDEATPRADRGEAVLPIGYAAARASQNPGTEIDGTEVGGALRGAGGRWVTLMRRRLRPTGAPESPQEHATEPGPDDGHTHDGPTHDGPTHDGPGHDGPGHDDAPAGGPAEAS